ncbi:MAG TPA: hypothetical protein VHO90_04870 [Bacteroidales bacterium]|nr:hypothetical protein [Bacteroidales bacterium]
MLNYIKPMLPAELSRPFDNPEWIFENNHGGFRAVTVIANGNAAIYSNKTQLFNKDFPQIAKDLETLGVDVILDGEIVMLNSEGKPDFNKLVNYRYNTHLPVRYYIFDLLSFEGRSLLKTPLIERKIMLQKIFQRDYRSLIYNRYVHEYGCDLYSKALKDDLEGINAKKIDSLYHPGKTSNDWQKIHNKTLHELYICGFTKPTYNNKGIGSIIAGYKEDNTFCYAGYITSGLDKLHIQELYTQLIPLVTEKSPFTTEIKSDSDIVWVHPELKCKVKYLDLTKDHLMQPVLLA